MTKKSTIAEIERRRDELAAEIEAARKKRETPIEELEAVESELRAARAAEVPKRDAADKKIAGGRLAALPRPLDSSPGAPRRYRQRLRRTRIRARPLARRKDENSLASRLLVAERTIPLGERGSFRAHRCGSSDRSF